MRTLSLIATSALSAFLATAAMATPQLKAEVDVTAAIVTLGDLVEGAESFADIAVFRAPDLGTTGHVDAAEIIATARAHGLDGIDTNGLTRIAVTRPARLIAHDTLATIVSEAIASRYGLHDAGNLGVTLSLPGPDRAVPADAQGDVRIEDVLWSSRTGRLQATGRIVRPSGSSVAIKLTGTAVETHEVVVMAREVERGTTVSANDIKRDRIAATAFDLGLMVAPEDVIGMAAKRPLRPGQTLRSRDLALPELVTRGETVTLVLGTAGLSLTARGTAMAAGTKGDRVSVMNATSRRIVEGTVTGRGVVTITGPASTLATISN